MHAVGPCPSPPATGVFVAADLLGRPALVCAWERVPPPAAAPPPPPTTRHHVIVVDRSGSMYGDVADLRAMVKKLLVVEEFRRPDLLVSLVSYSSRGDEEVHLRRVRADQLGDAAWRQVDRIQASGLTCISGGLELASALREPGEETTITLHSDGYANDRSPGEERRAIMDRILPALRGVDAGGPFAFIPAVVHTVAYRPSSDFRFLAEVANAAGGACVQAGTVADVYEALERAQRAASGPPALPRRVDVRGADFLLRAHAGLRRVLLSAPGGTQSVAVDDGDAVWRVWRIGEVSAGRYREVAAPDAPATGLVVADVLAGRVPVRIPDLAPMLVMARGLVGAGLATLAKQVALSTGVVALRRHARALTGPQVADLAADLDALLFSGQTGAESWGDGRSVPPMPVAWAAARAARGPLEVRPEPALTLPELLAVLGRHPRSVKVHLPSLAEGYRRRGLKRVSGKWVASGAQAPAIVPPPYYAEPRRAGTDAQGWCDLVSVEQNDAEATVNITLAQPVDLVEGHVDAGGARRDARKVVPEVAGVSLEELRTYRSFAVVGDGEVNLRSLPCRIVHMGLHAELARRGVVFGPFDPARPRDLSLDLPMLRGGEPPMPAPDLVLRALRLAVLQRLLAASLRSGEASPYSPEQLAALRDHCVTPALYYSPPTCSPYGPDGDALKRAQAAGLVDSRVRYRVTFGSAGVLGVGDLRSGNEALQRRWVVQRRTGPIAGQLARGAGIPELWAKLPKPTCADFFQADDVREKNADESRRQVPDAADALAGPIYRAAARKREDAGGFGAQGSGGLTIADMGLPQDFGAGATWVDPAARASALRVVEDALEDARAALREAVFYVGASGSVPESWGPAVDAATFEQQRGALGYSVPKSDRDGQFYFVANSLGHTVASVVAEESLYSVVDVDEARARDGLYARQA